MAKRQLRPIRDRLIVKRDEPKKTKMGLVLPDGCDTVNRELASGTVLRVGIGRQVEGIAPVTDPYRGVVAYVHAMEIREGDKILFNHHGAQRLELDGEEFFVLSEEDVWAVIEEVTA